jgi:hypothetical protein
MNPWLVGFLTCLAVLVLAWLGGKLVESRSTQWEEDEVRRIAADDQDEKRCPDRLMGIYTGAMPRTTADDDLPTEIDPDRFDAAVRRMAATNTEDA